MVEELESEPPTKKLNKESNKKIKICFVLTYGYSLFNLDKNNPIGGAEVQLYKISKALVKDGRFDVSFVVGDFNQKDLEIREGIKIYKILHIELIKIYFLDEVRIIPISTEFSRHSYVF